jgi:hypothetical protein
MSLRLAVAALTAGCFATGCAFFDEPMSDSGVLIPSSEPAVESTVATPASDPLQTTTDSAATDNRRTTSQAAASASYLVVAPIDRFPRDAQNIAVVHLTQRATRRDVSLCKALMDNIPTVDVGELPPNPLTVVVWPVPNDNAGANCIEMISDYEPIEITPEAAQRITDDSTGPYLLTRNLPSGKRMIFDISFMPNSAMSATINQWLSLLGSSPADWPEYRRAR